MVGFNLMGSVILSFMYVKIDFPEVCVVTGFLKPFSVMWKMYMMLTSLR